MDILVSTILIYFILSRCIDGSLVTELCYTNVYCRGEEIILCFKEACI